MDKYILLPLCLGKPGVILFFPTVAFFFFHFRSALVMKGSVREYYYIIVSVFASFNKLIDFFQCLHLTMKENSIDHPVE